MNPIKFIIVVSMVLLGTDLIYHQVVNGQNNQTLEEKKNDKLDKVIHDYVYKLANELGNKTEQRIRDNPNMTFDECMSPIDTSPATCMEHFNVNETEMETWEANKRIDEAAALAAAGAGNTVTDSPYANCIMMTFADIQVVLSTDDDCSRELFAQAVEYYKSQGYTDVGSYSDVLGEQAISLNKP